MPIGKDSILAWLKALEQTYSENREWLTELDSAIGDADHGSNMDRGFKAVHAELAATSPDDVGAIFKSVATILIRTVGGASGPLYGTFFLRGSAVCAGKTALNAHDLLAFFGAGVEGIRQRGKAEPGDKTMLDTFVPALAAMQTAVDEGDDVARLLQKGLVAAEDGMKSTTPLQAKKGRASYLGPRSIGHQDPGATSAWLMLRAAAQTLGSPA